MLQASMKKLHTKRQTGEGGFTLVELLIVIVILGVLSGIVVFSVSGITNNSAKVACATERVPRARTSWTWPWVKPSR